MSAVIAEKHIKMIETPDFYIPDCCGGETDFETEITQEGSHENGIYDAIWDE